MSDLIDRQVAIDKLQKEINKGIPPFDDVMGAIRCGVRLARNIIEDLPSADPHWIPCSERLPELYEDVLITDSDGVVDIASMDDYWDGYEIKRKWYLSNYGFINVLAWMPLPKPYGGESE